MCTLIQTTSGTLIIIVWLLKKKFKFTKQESLEPDTVLTHRETNIEAIGEANVTRLASELNTR